MPANTLKRIPASDDAWDEFDAPPPNATALAAATAPSATTVLAAPVPAPQSAPPSPSATNVLSQVQGAPGAAQAAPVSPTTGGTSAWDDFDQPAPGFVPATPDDPNGVAKNGLTGLMRVPGAIVGAPAVVGHAEDWLANKVSNAVHGTHTTTDQYIDKNDPGQKMLEQGAQLASDLPFKATGFTPYEPTSIGGKIGQAAVTGLGAGLVDPLAIAGDVQRGASLLRNAGAVGANALKTGAASGAAEASQQALPDTPAVAAAAALLAHGGTSATLGAAKFGGGLVADTTRQVFAAGKQGEREAGRVLAPVDNTQPGLANPTAADLAAGQSGVRAETDAIGPGLPDWQAGTQLRAGLQGRADTLKAARAKVADAAYDQFRAQAPLPSAALEPFMKSPSFRKAVGAANSAVLDEGGEPMTQLFNFGDGEDVPSFLKGDAIPTDVLHRVKSQLGDAVNAAAPGSAAQRTATMLNNRFGDFLEQQYPASGDFPGYGAIRQNYADASRPLDPMTYGPVERTLAQDTQYGQSRYTLADERVPDLFLRSGATRADMNQLVDAFGGDKTAATSALQEHLAGVAQGAVRPDGTLDTVAFDKAMAPYQRSMGNLGLWFPNLAGKFSSAKAAQGTLDNLQAQRGLADAVSSGAMRDSTGVVTGSSFNRWLASNKDALAKTQNPAAVMRLQSIGNALKGAKPGELADALKSELAPAAIGGAFGGLEGGVLGTLLHKVAGAAFDGVDAKRQAAFSAAIERAAMDPNYAGRIAAASGRQGRSFSPVRALVRAVATTPVAVKAAQGGAR